MMNEGTQHLDLWRLLLSKFIPTLPSPTGPLAVGFCDLEYQSPTKINSSLANEGNIFLRLFYPSSSQLNPSPLKRPLWFSDSKYLRGYLNFLNIPEVIG